MKSDSFEKIIRHDKIKGERFIKETNVPFLSDENVKVMMEKNLEKIKVKNWKVPARVKVPEEFRQSIFNTSFHTFREKTTSDIDEKDEKR